MGTPWFEGHGVSYTPRIDLSESDTSNGQQMMQPTIQSQQALHAVSHVLPRAPASKKAKGVAKRCSNYSGVEDELICSAYLNVSKDPIVGVNQPLQTYWARITQYYEENWKTPIKRTLSSIQHRWGEINRETQQFAGFYAEIERKNQSGKCEDDKIKDALQLYEGLDKGPFKFLHCWFILRREQKWLAELSQPKVKKSKQPSSSAEPSEEASAEPTEDVEGFVRPIGRDRAKKQRSNSSVNSQSTACFEFLQQFQSDRARFEAEMQATSKDESKEISERYEAKLAIQREQVAIQKEQVAIQKRMLELQEKDRMDRVMNVDVDKMAPWVREYYIAEQKEIAARKKQSQSSHPAGQ